MSEAEPRHWTGPIEQYDPGSNLRKLTPEQELELVKDYTEHEMSWKQMMLKYNLSKETVSVYLRRHNVLRQRANPNTTDKRNKFYEISMALKARERERRIKSYARENRKFRSYVMLLQRRVQALEAQVKELGGTPVTEGSWRVGDKRKAEDTVRPQ